MDEPVSSLDEKARKEMYKLIYDTVSTSILVTHTDIEWLKQRSPAMTCLDI